VKKLENVAKVIHPFSTVLIDFVEFKESDDVVKQEERYELGYPSDIVPYGEISEGFDCAIRKMHPDEEATLSLKSKVDTSNRHRYQVRIVSVCHSIPISSMNDSRKLSYSEDLRQRGNEFYREKSFESALLCYKNALYWASIASDDNRMMRFEIQGQIFANISALHFQRKSYELAVHCCGRVLDDKKFQKKIKNLNALLIRRADANSQLNEFDLVKNDLSRLTNPSRAEASRTKAILNDIAIRQKKTDSQMAQRLSNMFS